MVLRLGTETMHCVNLATKNIEGQTFTSATFLCPNCYNRLCEASIRHPPLHTKWHYSLPPEPISLPIHAQTRKTSTSTPVVLNDNPRSLKIDQLTTLTNTTISAASNATRMHLSTVHQSSYYSGTSSSAADMTFSPCFNMTMSSRIMRHCRPCTSLNGTNATSLFASPSSTHGFPILPRNIDDRESQGSHTMATVGIIIGIIIGCFCVAAIIGWSVKSNKKAFAKSQNRRGQVVRRGNGNGHGHGGFSEKDQYQGDGGLDAPPRTARSHGTRFPVRSQPGHSGRSNQYGRSHHSDRSNQPRGPYQDGTPFSAVAGFEESGGHSRGRYTNGRPSR